CTDEDLALIDARRHREAVVLRVLFRYGNDRPEHLSGRGVESHQASVHHGYDDFAFVQCDAPVMDAAAETNAAMNDLRVIAPHLFPAPGVDGKRDAPVRDSIKHTVCKKRRCFLISATVADLDRPGLAQTANVRRIDLF